MIDLTPDHSPEWYEERRQGITSTDIPILLGISPYKSEAQLAREKNGEEPEPITEERARAMRIGKAQERLIQSEYELMTGRRLRRVNRLIHHPTIPWALTSLDFESVGDKPPRIVEAKTSRSSRWTGLPFDIEAQVQWQLGVTGRPLADVAVLLFGSDFPPPFEVQANPILFDQLVTIAEDFRRRLVEGGPFTESKASARRQWPVDDGLEMASDLDLDEKIDRLLEIRARRVEIDKAEDAAEAAIMARMGSYSRVTNSRASITWKRSKDSTTVAWDVIADGLLRQLPEDQREALVGLYTTTKPGSRRFLVTVKGEPNE